MYNNDIFQITIFFYSSGFGLFLSCFYDFYKTIHYLIFKSSKMLVFSDFIYGILFSLFTFLFILVINFGQLRLYIIVGIALGFAAWNFTLSQFFVKFLFWLKYKTSDIFYRMGNIISLPINEYL